MFESNAFWIIFLVALIITMVWSRHRARRRRAEVINWNQNAEGDYIRMGDDGDPVVYVNPSRIAPSAAGSHRGVIQSVEGEGAIKRLSTHDRKSFGPVFSTTEESGRDQNVAL